MTHVEDKFYKSVPLLLKSIDVSLQRIANSLEASNRTELMSIEISQDLKQMLELREAQSNVTASMLYNMNAPMYCYDDQEKENDEQ